MPFAAKILADSVCVGSPRLTTFEITYPRCVHAELMTHRVFSRNSASSRAIPVEKMLERIEQDPFIPLDWGKNQKGMQAGEPLSETAQAVCLRQWLNARDEAVTAARHLAGAGLHKQIANRIVEPWMWITVIVSSTEYGNFFKLRCHDAAEPHIRRIAEMMRELYLSQDPRVLQPGDWHLPLHKPEADGDLTTAELVKVCTGRCARVSYLTHAGTREPGEDLRLHDDLSGNGHWSPFEHCAEAAPGESKLSGNFGYGWIQYRKTFPGEAGVTRN